jgi:UDP-N-acetyl-D-glucosamine dehydrogenase
MRVAILGQGYVGLPLALAAIEAGHDVVGFDVDATRVAMLAGGRSYVTDVRDEQVTQALATGRYLPTDATASLADFEVAVIAVPTGLADGAPDLSHVTAAGTALAPYVRRGATVVLESTTYPGTTTEHLAPILAAGSGLVPGTDFHLGYSPERVDPGNADWPYSRIPKVVSGTTQAGVAAVSEFYASVVDTVVPVSDVAVAELTKVLENTFRQVNIALINEMAVFARALGVDIDEAITAASTKPFGFMPFRPGPGVGGHCLPIDPTYLAWRVQQRTGERFRFVELANQINGAMPAYVAARSLELLPGDGAKALVIGLAYKADTGDLRGSPGIEVVRALAAAGVEVTAHDPLVMPEDVPPDVRTVALCAETVEAADLVVITAAHSACDLDLVVRHAHAVLDTRHCVRGPRVQYL